MKEKRFDEKLLTITEAADVLGVSRTTVRALIHKREILVSKLNRTIKVREADILNLKEGSWRKLS